MTKSFAAVEQHPLGDLAAPDAKILCQIVGRERWRMGNRLEFDLLFHKKVS